MNEENNLLMVVSNEDKTAIKVVEAMDKEETHEVAKVFSKLEKNKWRRML